VELRSTDAVVDEEGEVIRHLRGRVLLPPQLPELTPPQAIALAMQLYEAGMLALRWRQENEALRTEEEAAKE
jgi:hypothetical protein